MTSLTDCVQVHTWHSHAQQAHTAMPLEPSTTTTASNVTRATTVPPLLVVSLQASAGVVTTVRVGP